MGGPPFKKVGQSNKVSTSVHPDMRLMWLYYMLHSTFFNPVNLVQRAMCDVIIMVKNFFQAHSKIMIILEILVCSKSYKNFWWILLISYANQARSVYRVINDLSKHIK